MTLRNGDSWTFDLQKPEDGLILAGGECGLIDISIFLGHEHYIKANLRKKAEKIKEYLRTLHRWSTRRPKLTMWSASHSGC